MFCCRKKGSLLFQNNAKGFRIFYRLQLEVINTQKNNRICPDLPWVRVHPSDHLPLRRLQHPKVLRGGDDHPLRAFAGRHRKFSRSLGGHHLELYRSLSDTCVHSEIFIQMAY